MFNVPPIPRPPNYTRSHDSQKSAVNAPNQQQTMFKFTNAPASPLSAAQPGSLLSLSQIGANKPGFEHPTQLQSALGLSSLGNNTVTQASHKALQPSLGLGLSSNNSFTQANNKPLTNAQPLGLLSGASQTIFGGSLNKSGTNSNNVIHTPSTAPLFANITSNLAPTNPLFQNVQSYPGGSSNPAMNKYNEPYPIIPNGGTVIPSLPKSLNDKVNSNKDANSKGPLWVKCISAIEASYNSQKTKEMLRVQYYRQNNSLYNNIQPQMHLNTGFAPPSNPSPNLFSNPNAPSVHNPFLTPSQNNQQQATSFFKLSGPKNTGNIQSSTNQSSFFSNQSQNGTFMSSPPQNKSFFSGQNENNSLFGNQAQNNSLVSNQTSNGSLFGNQSQISSSNMFQETASTCQDIQQRFFDTLNQNLAQNNSLFMPLPQSPQRLRQQNELYCELYQLLQQLQSSKDSTSIYYFLRQFDPDLIGRILYGHQGLIFRNAIYERDQNLIVWIQQFKKQLSYPIKYDFESFYQGYIHNDGFLFSGDVAVKQRLERNPWMVERIMDKRRTKNYPLLRDIPQCFDIFPEPQIPSNACFMPVEANYDEERRPNCYDYNWLKEDHYEEALFWKGEKEKMVRIIDERKKY